MKKVLPWIAMCFLISPLASMAADSAPAGNADILQHLYKAIATTMPEAIGTSDAERLTYHQLNSTPAAGITALAQPTIETYFPLQNGDSKTYTSSVVANAVYQYQQTTINGHSAFVEIDSVDDSRAYYGYSGDTLVMYGADAEGLSLTFDTPLEILEENLIAQGGTMQSQTTTRYSGMSINIGYTGTVERIGSVTVPAGTFADCIKLSMTFSYTVAGDSESMDLEDVWVLAPGVGKTKIIVMDQFMNSRGWMELTSGTIGEQDVENLVTFVPTGQVVSDGLWIGAVIYTEDKGPIEGVWQLGGQDTTARGDLVIWGYFYANPDVMSWGSQDNPDLFVKIWKDVNGPIYVDYFHVSVPNITVYTDFEYDGTPDQSDRATLSDRFVEHYWIDGASGSRIQAEDGVPASGYSADGNPAGTLLINDLRIGTMINTEDKGPIEGVWRLGGQDTTARGDQVVWGYFYTDPQVMSWGSQDNPDLFVKIWFDVTGPVYVDYFHVSVPDIEVYSEMSGSEAYSQQGTTILSNRFVEHSY